MITLHFTVSNYSEDFIELALCAEDKVLKLLSYINMTEEEKEDYLYEYIDTFVEALYNKSGEH